MNTDNPTIRTAASAYAKICLLFLAVAIAVFCSAGVHGKAFAVDTKLNAAVTTQASSDVHYIAVLGADTWRGSAGSYESWQAGSGSYHTPSSDLAAVVRIDTSTGAINILTIPRDTEYIDIRKHFPKATTLKCNQAFKNGFNAAVKTDAAGAWMNYDEAMKAASEASCNMIEDITGIKVEAYVTVDLYTLQTIVDKLGGLDIDIPVGIKDYRMYSNGLYYSVNDGKTGKATIDGWDAMIASRARKPYAQTSQKTGEILHRYRSLAAYKGDYPQLLLSNVGTETVNGESIKYTYYYFNDDSIRQFLCRRMMWNLLDAGLSRSEGAFGFFWNVLVSSNLVWTNMPESDASSLADKLVAAKNNNKLVVYGASALLPISVGCYDYGVYQYLIPMNEDVSNHGLSAWWTKTAKSYAKANKKQMQDAVAQFKAGKAMTAGWGDEVLADLTIANSQAGESTSDSGNSNSSESAQLVVIGGVTYTLTAAAEAVPVSAADSSGVTIPSTITVNNKMYKVIGLCKYGMQEYGSVMYKATSASKVEPMWVTSTSTVAIPATVSLNGKKYTVEGLCERGTKKSRSVTYKGTGESTVSPVSVAGSSAVAIPATVKLNGKKYTVVGLCKNGTKKSGSVTYKGTGASTVSPVSVAGSSAVAIPAMVKLNGKKYTVVGLCKNGTKKASSVTYKATSSKNVTVIKVPNKKSVAIPATVKLNGKSYKVTATSAKVFARSKIRTVTLGANISKIAANSFKGSKATKLVLKTTLLTKAKVKNSLKKSKIKTIKVSVAKSKKKSTVKKYKKYFSKKNAGWTVSKLTVK